MLEQESLHWFAKGLSSHFMETSTHCLFDCWFFVCLFCVSYVYCIALHWSCCNNLEQMLWHCDVRLSEKKCFFSVGSLAPEVRFGQFGREREGGGGPIAYSSTELIWSIIQSSGIWYYLNLLSFIQSSGIWYYQNERPGQRVRSKKQGGGRSELSIKPLSLPFQFNNLESEI